MVFAQKGIRNVESESDNGFSYWSKDVTTLNYLQIPINAVGKYGFLNNELSVFALVGPYFGFALSGKYKWEGKTTNPSGKTETDKGDEKIFTSGSGMSRFDFGLTFGAGVEFKKIFFRFHYEAGISNQLKNQGSGSNKAKFKNNNLNFSFGYYFLEK